MRFKSLIFVLAVSFFYTCTPKIVFAANSCRDLFPTTGEQTYFDRKSDRPEIIWNDDLSYIRGSLDEAATGSMKDFYSSKFDTRIYYTGTGTFRGKDTQEDHLVDPDAKAVFVFFHGSGTVKASGKNFFGLMNTLNSIGISAISFDMPFHSDGPTKDAFNNLDYTMNWIKEIVETVKKSGKPVVLVGHSFGPDMIFELVSRYPHLVNDVLPMNPAGFTPELKDWYENYTTKMNFGGDVMESELGGRWAARIADQLTWNTGVRNDPTLINPNLRMTIVSGDREEYVPAPIGGANKTPIGKNTYDISVPLKKIFSRADVVIAEGVGHYIFNHTDENGDNFVQKQILAKVGMKPSELKAKQKEISNIRNERDPAWRITDLYQNDPSFRAWMAFKFFGSNKARSLILQISKKPDQYDTVTRNLLAEWPQARKARDQEIIAKIKATEKTHPAFFQQHKERITKQNDTSLYPEYLNLISGRK